MTRTPIIAIVTAVTIAVCIARISPQSVAEPIPGGDTGASSKAPAQPQELTEAENLFRKGDYDGALKMAKEAVKKDADLSPAHVIMAQWFFQANVPMGVRAALERAVVEAPVDPEAYILIGNIALSERRITEARLLYEKADGLMASWKGSAKRKDKLLPQVQSGLAATCEARDDWTGARKHLEAWLKLDAKSVPALQRLAQCLFRQKNVEGALEKLKEAAKIEPDMLTPEAVLAQWFARTGDQQSATKWMIAALNAAPRDARTRLVAAQWAWETGQYDEAKKQADAALQLDPKYFEAKNFRGVIAMFQKDYKRAEAYFESALQQAPKNLKFNASNNLALALVEQDDDSKKQRALGLADDNVQHYPRHSEARSTHGWILYKLGRLDDAEKALNEVVSAGSYTADTAYYCACVLAGRGREAEAKDFLSRALKSPAPFAHREEAKALLAKLSEAPKK